MSLSFLKQPTIKESDSTLDIISKAARVAAQESNGQFNKKLGIPVPTTQEVKSEVRAAIAQADSDDAALIDSHKTPEVIEMDSDSSLDTADRITGDRKLSRLVEDDFPFDESQLAAIEGLIDSPYGCLTGAAGTGKTTSVKKLVDRLMETTSIGMVNMADYWSSSTDDRQDAYESDDTYDMPEGAIPTIAIVAFTGRATQMVKKNFPRDWHGNIMTIHRLLGFVPESYEDWDPEWTDKETGELGAYRTKMRFVPTYTADCLLPWDIIIIDEAGMLGLDLWHQLWAAIKPGCRVYFVGDINQLPPVHGKSIFGFAMAKLPAYELTKVHRQQGVNNPIVDNAWRIIHGQMPQSEGKFQMIALKGTAAFASRQVRAMAPKLMELGVYDPIRDTIITPINGEHGSRGFDLGQLPLNEEFARIFNPKSIHPRYIIDGGRERKQFAVGDKVMATKNDYEAGITNGMTGIITEICEHQGYAGEKERFGLLDEVNARFANDAAADVIGEFSLEDLESTMIAQETGREKAKEKRDRGPASHIVTVRFGTEDHGFELPFSTLAEVGSLMTAYVATCHKMQGGECPTIVIICHDSHKHMLYREWLYTAVTRASDRCILLYTESALKTALNKQTIKGRTLREKVASFNALMTNGAFDMAKEVKLPYVESTSLTIMDREETQVVTEARLTTEKERNGGLAQLIAKAKKLEAEPKSESWAEKEARVNTVTAIFKGDIHVHVHQQATPEKAPVDIRAEPAPVQAESMAPRQTRLAVRTGLLDQYPRVPALPDLRRPTLVSQWGAVKAEQELRRERDKLLLTYQPAPKVESPVPSPKSTGLSFLQGLKK